MLSWWTMIPKLVSSLFILFIALISSAVSIEAKEWRGIVPLQSTRKDVERRFNECARTTGRCSFTLGNEEVLIVFSGQLQEGLAECSVRMLAEVVLAVDVTYKKPISLRNFQIDKKRFKKFDPSTPRGMGFVGYIDDISGLVIRSYRGEINQIVYIATRSDRKRCPSYYDDPRSFAAVFIELCCPSFNLNCPQDSPQAGERITFSVSTTEKEPGFQWEITEGRIVSGQWTSSIIVDTAGLEGKTVTATIELSVGHQSHTNAQSCSVKIQPKRPN